MFPHGGPGSPGVTVLQLILTPSDNNNYKYQYESQIGNH